MKLLMMRGLPGAGKSTKAKELASQMGNTVRVNKDLLREMLHFGQWLPRNESGVIKIEQEIASYFLSEEKQNVIVDDTNLTSSHEQRWRDFVTELQQKGLVDLEFEMLDMNTDVLTCIERDANRDKQVGQSTIMGLALENGMIDRNVHYVICDLDGTLCDIEHRRKYVREQPKDWKKFFEGISEDSLRKDVYEKVEDTLISNRENGKRVYLILVSARPDTYRAYTEKWLEEHEVNDYAALFMRRAGDSREDSIVKREILNKYFKDKSKIIKVFDDRPRVIRMWREEGLEVEDVGTGEEF